MEAKNMGLMSETDERWWKILRTGYLYCEFTEITNSWLKQWCENPDYNQYNAKDVELLTKGTGLFLIPKEDKKPIKLIIA
jgi:hypothetical protein